MTSIRHLLNTLASALQEPAAQQVFNQFGFARP